MLKEFVVCWVCFLQLALCQSSTKKASDNKSLTEDQKQIAKLMGMDLAQNDDGVETGKTQFPLFGVVVAGLGLVTMFAIVVMAKKRVEKNQQSRYNKKMQMARFKRISIVMGYESKNEDEQDQLLNDDAQFQSIQIGN